MKHKHKEYILENINKKSIEQIARDLGLKERKIRQYLKGVKTETAKTEEKGEVMPGQPKVKSAFILFLIAVLTVGIYFNSLKGGFVFDDKPMIVQYDFIKDIRNIPKAFISSTNKFGNTNYYRPLLLANPWGCIGEVSALLLILGGIYLIATRVIDWRIPVGYIGSLAVLTAFTGRDPLFFTLAGGLLIGAFFMATDYTTSPMSRRGKLVYAFGLGVTTWLLRLSSNNPEGVMFSILFMNALVPLIDRYVLPQPFSKPLTAEGDKEAEEAIPA